MHMQARDKRNGKEYQVCYIDPIEGEITLWVDDAVQFISEDIDNFEIFNTETNTWTRIKRVWWLEPY